MSTRVDVADKRDITAQNNSPATNEDDKSRSFFASMCRGLEVSVLPVSLFLMAVQYSGLTAIIVMLVTGQAKFDERNRRADDFFGECFGECMSDDCPCTSARLTRSFFAVLLAFGFVSFVNLLFSSYSSFRLRIHSCGGQTHDKTAKTLERVKQTPPEVWDHVHCYSESSSTNSDGSTSTSIHTKHKEKIIFPYHAWGDSSHCTTELTSHRVVVINFVPNLKYATPYTEHLYLQHQAGFKAGHARCDQKRTFTSGSGSDDLIAVPLISLSPDFDPSVMQGMLFLSILCGCNWVFKVWFSGAYPRATFYIQKTIRMNEPIAQTVATQSVPMLYQAPDSLSMYNSQLPLASVNMHPESRVVHYDVTNTDTKTNPGYVSIELPPSVSVSAYAPVESVEM